MNTQRALAALVVACLAVAPAVAQVDTGSADFSTYVSMGDSQPGASEGDQRLSQRAAWRPRYHHLPQRQHLPMVRIWLSLINNQ